MSTRLRRRIEGLLDRAGLELNGSRPRDPQVHDRRFYRRVLGSGSLGLGESYVEGWWDCEALDAFFAAILTARLDRAVRGPALLFDFLQARLFNLQLGRRAFTVGAHHYDLGNELYGRMLDRRMIYSCGYWPGVEDLDTAQEQKLEMVARKLYLEPGMRVLDIGCGWGGTARYLAEEHGVEVVGLTVSAEQAEYARENCRGLPVEIRLQDYREVDEVFDRVFSIGMFEHVGHRNYAAYMATTRRVLAPDGLALLHSIGAHRTQYQTDPWIARYIFPNSMAPSVAQIGRAAENEFQLEDWHNIGVNYDPTLMAWHRNVEAHRDSLGRIYDERFFRMWRYYLLSCAAAFRVQRNPVWQIVMSPQGVAGGYQRPVLPPEKADSGARKADSRQSAATRSTQVA